MLYTALSSGYLAEWTRSKSAILGLDEMDFSRDLIEPATLCERDRVGGREVEVSESVVEREEERELRGPG